MRLMKRGHKSHRNAVGATASQFNGVGAPYHEAYTWHPLPDSGANQWSWDRLALPTYSPGGLGCPNGLASDLIDGFQPANAGQIVFAPSSAPVANAVQGATLYMLGDPGTPAGYFVMQPLTDTSPAGSAFSGVPMPSEEAIAAYGVD